MASCPTRAASGRSLPEDVEKVILKAMAQYPEQRFQTPAEFMKALEAAFGPQTLPDRPVTAPAPPPAMVAPKPSTEPKVYPAPQLEEKKEYSWLVFALGGLAAVVLLFGLGIFLIFFNRGGDEVAEVPTPLPGAPSVTAVADVNVRSGPDVAYEVIGVLLQGQTAEAVGVSADGLWWAINFPASPTGQGWVSAEFVIPENTANLPILQAPPPPTPTKCRLNPRNHRPSQHRPPPEPTATTARTNRNHRRNQRSRRLRQRCRHREPTQPPPEATLPPPEPTLPPPPLDARTAHSTDAN